MTPVAKWSVCQLTGDRQTDGQTSLSSLKAHYVGRV